MKIFDVIIIEGMGSMLLVQQLGNPDDLVLEFKGHAKDAFGHETSLLVNCIVKPILEYQV